MKREGLQKAIYIVIVLIAGLGFFWFWGKEKTKEEHLVFEQGAALTLADGESAENLGQEVKPGATNIASENKTELLARNIFLDYFNIKKLGQGAAISADEIASTSLQKIVLEGPLPKIYTLGDLAIVPDTEAALAPYSKSLQDAVSKYFYAELGNELQTLVDGLNKIGDRAQNTASEKESLARAAKTYEALAHELTKVSVPHEKSQKHLEVVNALAGLSKSVIEMEASLADPVRALSAVKTYLSHAQALEALVTQP